MRLISFVAAGLLTSATASAATYESLPACEKADILWNEIENSAYDTLPQWTGFEVLKLAGMAVNPFTSVARKFLGVTMERESDEMPDGRFKHIHTYGSVARISFEPDPATPFSGTYKGVPCGLVRMSLAVKPDANNSKPGLAIKFLVDGRPSLNFMAMYSLEGQPEHNFFANDFSNFVEPPTSSALQLLARAFALVAKDPTKVDVNYLAAVDANGLSVAVTERKGPEQIYLVPNRQDLNFPKPFHEVREDFATIPAGTTLYEVYGRMAGSTQRVHLGRLVSRSQFVASEYGDSKLFFRHERFNGE